MRTKGFTLVEILVVVAIVAILAVGSQVVFQNNEARARDAIRIAHMEILSNGVKSYATDNGGQVPHNLPNDLSLENDLQGKLLNLYVAGEFPTDPLPVENSFRYVYSLGGFIGGTSLQKFEFNTQLEAPSNNDFEQEDGGNVADIYEVGRNIEQLSAPQAIGTPVFTTCSEIQWGNTLAGGGVLCAVSLETVQDCSSVPLCAGQQATVCVVNDVIVGGAHDGEIYIAGTTILAGLGGSNTDIIVGTNFGDIIQGGNANDVICGLDGDDVIDGGNHDDVIYAGNGNDTIYGNNHADTLYGEAGNDFVYADNHDDFLDGGSGTDSLDGGSHTDTCVNGEVLVNCEEAPPMCGNNLQEDPEECDSADLDGKSCTTVPGGYVGGTLGCIAAGQEEECTFDTSDCTTASIPSSPAMTCNGKTATIYVSNGIIVGGSKNGQPYQGVLSGGSSENVILGTDGTDTISGGSSADTICAFGGDDDLDGGSSADYIFGGSGDDEIDGGSGADVLDAGDGNDDISGGSDNDFIQTGNGNDTVRADSGNDTVSSGAGNDLIYGGSGNDTIDGGPDDDTADGGTGTDTCPNVEHKTSC